MMESDIGAILIFLVVGIITAVICHLKVKEYLVSALIAGVISTVIYQVINYIVAGYLDPFFIMALVNGFLAYMVLSLIIGLPFLIARRKQIAKE